MKYKPMKVILCVSILAMLCLPTTAAAEGGSEVGGTWTSFRRNVDNNGYTQSQTAKNAEAVELRFANNLGAEVEWSCLSAPLIVDGSIVMAVNDTIVRLDGDGNVIQKGQLSGSVGYFSYPAYGDGKLFVAVDQMDANGVMRGYLQALDSKTFQPLWISESFGDGHQGISPVTYHDGCVYIGAVQYVSDAETNGAYWCFGAADEDAARADEEKSAMWTYTSDKPGTLKGYYWSGGVVVGDNIVFGGDDGFLVSHSLKEDKVIDTIAADGSIRATILADAQLGRVYAATKNGYVMSVGITKDGTFDASLKKTAKTTGEAATSTPVAYNGKLYVASGAALDVLDADTMEILRTAQLGGVTQSSPLLSGAYAAKQNHDEVYLYLALNQEDGVIVVVKDGDGQEPAVDTLYTPPKEAQNYCTASLIADESGTLYFANDSATLFALANREAKPEDSGAMVWIWIGAGVLVLAVLVVVILKKARKKGQQ